MQKTIPIDAGTLTPTEAAHRWIAVLERAKPRIDRGRGRWLRVHQTNRATVRRDQSQARHAASP